MSNLVARRITIHDIITIIIKKIIITIQHEVIYLYSISYIKKFVNLEYNIRAVFLHVFRI